MVFSFTAGLLKGKIYFVGDDFFGFPRKTFDFPKNSFGISWVALIIF